METPAACEVLCAPVHPPCSAISSGATLMPHTPLSSFSDGPVILCPCCLFHSLHGWPLHSYGSSLRGHPCPPQRGVDWKRENSLLRQGHARRKNRCSLGRGVVSTCPPWLSFRSPFGKCGRRESQQHREGMVVGEGSCQAAGLKRSRPQAQLAGLLPTDLSSAL